MHRRLIAGSLAALLLLGSGVLPGSAAAQPLDVSAIDCEGPAGDPATGTAEWYVRDWVNVYCSEHRKVDMAFHPVTALPVPALQGGSINAGWNDAYRQPARHNNVRFRYQQMSIGGVQSEIYRPCSSDTCGETMPEGLSRFDPPYPAVLIFHGLASRRELHWWSSQTLAEAGYLVVTMNAPSYPNGPSNANAQTLMSWLFAGEGPAADADLDRVGVAGHSLGGGLTTSFQGDPRVSALVAWDGGTNVQADPTHVTPELFLRADYDGWPGYPNARTSPPDNPVRASGFWTLRGKGVDSMVVTLRASTHLDWTGGPLFGSRYAEAVNVYYTIAWFDRYLKGKLVLEGDETSEEEEAAERARRQAIAQEAFERLTADVFDDSADRHNISQGFWDPVQAATSGDALYGGNVPYTIEGLRAENRLSFYYHSSCFVSVPDYTDPSGSSIAARAETGPEENMRDHGCPQASLLS